MTTVAELRKQLEEYPDDMPVYLCTDGGELDFVVPWDGSIWPAKFRPFSNLEGSGECFYVEDTTDLPASMFADVVLIEG